MLDGTKEIISMREPYINHVKNHCDGTGSRDQNRDQMYEASPSGGGNLVELPTDAGADPRDEGCFTS
jgi:hypothetical protein